MTATLSDILLNPLLLYHTAPYLSLRSICALIRTCKAFRAALLDNGQLYRYVELEDAILQMLKRVPEHKDIHELVELPGTDLPARSYDCPCGSLICNICTPRRAFSDDIAAKFSNRFEVTHKDCIFGLHTRPKYGIHELGRFIGITSEQIQAINNHKGMITTPLSMLVAAILSNRLICEVPPPKRSKRGKSSISITDSSFYTVLSNICIKLTRVALNALVDGRQLIMYIRILVLDGIKLDYCLVMQEVIPLVRRGVIPLSLLSVRETGLVKYTSALLHIGRQIELSAMEDAQPSRVSRPSILGIYLFGRKDSPSPQIWRLRSWIKPAVRRDGIRKKRGRNGSNSDGSNNSIGQDDSVMPDIGDQLSYQQQIWSQMFIGDGDSDEESNSSSDRSSATDPTHDWYRRTGEMIAHEDSLTYWALALSHWKSIMKANERNSTPGLRLVFDGVICPGPRHDEKWVENMQAKQAGLGKKVSHLNPRMATVALGSDGCRRCGSCPEPAASWPESSI